MKPFFRDALVATLSALLVVAAHRAMRHPVLLHTAPGGPAEAALQRRLPHVRIDGSLEQALATLADAGGVPIELREALHPHDEPRARVELRLDDVPLRQALELALWQAWSTRAWRVEGGRIIVYETLGPERLARLYDLSDLWPDLQRIDSELDDVAAQCKPPPPRPSNACWPAPENPPPDPLTYRLGRLLVYDRPTWCGEKMFVVNEPVAQQWVEELLDQLRLAIAADRPKGAGQ